MRKRSSGYHEGRNVGDRTEPSGTLWVESLHPSVTQSSVRDHFSVFGPISTTSVQKSPDGRNFGFVNFYQLSHAKAALQYDNTFFFGKKIKVSLKKSPYQLVSTTSSSGGTIWIGSLSPLTDEDILLRAFAAYETKISSVRIERDETGNSRRFGFVNFFTEEDARSALSRMFGLTIDGQKVKMNLKCSSPSGSPHSSGFQSYQHKRGNLQSRNLVSPTSAICGSLPPSAPRAAHSLSAYAMLPAAQDTKRLAPKTEFSDEDSLVVTLICAQFWKELVSEAKKVRIFVEKPRDENVITMTGEDSRGISHLKQWLTSKATELKKTFSTKPLLLDATRSPALNANQVWGEIKKIETKQHVEITWLDKDKQQGLIAKESIVHDSGQEKHLELLIKNILKEKSGAIVCGTTCDLDISKGLAKALAKEGGPVIQTEVERHLQNWGDVEDGGAVTIEGGLLKCNFLVFVVIPQCKQSSCSKEELSLFRTAVENALEEAERHGQETVAIPALTAGSPPFPSEDCASVTVQTVRQYLQSNPDSPIHQVRIVLPSDTRLINEFRKHFNSDSRRVRGFPQLRSLQEPSPVRWEYKSDSGQFKPYEPVLSQKLEEGFKIESPSLDMQIGRFTYKISFSSMVQVNSETGTARPIRRFCASDTLWYYQTDNDTYGPYNYESNTEIECAHANGLQKLTINTNGFDYLIDLKNMTQTNTKTFTTRRITRKACLPATTSEGGRSLRRRTSDVTVTIRGQSCDIDLAAERLKQVIDSIFEVKRVRIPKELSVVMKDVVHAVADSFGLRVIAWNSADDGSSLVQLEGVKQSVDEAVERLQEEVIDRQALALRQPKATEPEPEEWEPQTKDLELKLVDKESQEYRRIRKKMRDSMPSVKILRLERIQNKWLWRKYVRHRKDMSEKNKGDINEKELFHGTSATDPEKIYQSEDGFDMRYSRKGLWGQGSYFAEMASYSDQYSYSMGAGQKQMFVAKVLTGESANVPGGDKSLRMPPERSQVYSTEGLFGTTVKYDTVTGKTKGCRIYVTYNNDKAYPFYLITYTS